MSEAEDTSRGSDSSAAAAGGRLMNRDFVLLWQGQLVSQMGSQAFAVAMMFWTMEATGSASLMGLLMMLETLPSVALGPVAGALADRVSRKAIVVLCDALSGLVMLALATPFFIAETAHQLLITCLFAMALLVGALQTFLRPAAMAAIPDLVPVPKVAAANSLSQGSVQLSTILGQSVGGVLYGLVGAPLLFAADGLSYLFSAASESFIRLPRTHREPEALRRPPWVRFRNDIAQGLRHVWGNRGMTDFLILTAVVNCFAMPILVLLPFLVTDRLQRGADWYGFLLAAFGGGAIVGYLIAGSLQLPPRFRSFVLLGTVVATGGILAGVGLLRSPVLTLAALIVAGALNGYFNVIMATAFQLAAAPEYRGRVMGFVMTVAMAVAPLGMGLGGILGDLTGKDVPLIYGVCGGLIALTTILLGGRRSVREFLAFDPEKMEGSGPPE